MVVFMKNIIIKNFRDLLDRGSCRNLAKTGEVIFPNFVDILSDNYMVLDNLSPEDYLKKAHVEVEWHFDQKHWAEQNVFEAVAEFASLDLEVIQT